jgi:hypothetical protein
MIKYMMTALGKTIMNRILLPQTQVLKVVFFTLDVADQEPEPIAGEGNGTITPTIA